MINVKDWKKGTEEGAYGNIEIGAPGWFGLLAFFHRATERILFASGKNGVVHYSQVKEKFGDLRIHYSLFTKTSKKLYDETPSNARYEYEYREKMTKLELKLPQGVRDVVSLLSRVASDASISACMGCGSPSGMVCGKAAGWINNLCFKCTSSEAMKNHKLEDLAWIVPDVTLASLRAGAPESFGRLLNETQFLNLLKKSTEAAPSNLPEAIRSQMDNLLSLSLEETLERDHGLGVCPIHYLRPHENLATILQEHQYANLSIASDSGETFVDFLKKYDSKGLDEWLRLQVERPVAPSPAMKI